jgi:hypothetical protein
MLSHGPPGRQGAMLPGVAHASRGRRSSAQPWSWAAVLLVVAVTFLAGYLAGGGFPSSSPSSSSSSSSSSSPSSIRSATESHSAFASRSSKSWKGRPQDGLHTGGVAADQTEESGAAGFKSTRSSPQHANMTFEEIIAASGALDDRPAMAASDIGATGHPFYTVQPMQLLSWHPRSYLFPKFIDRSMAEHVIELATKRLAPSSLALRSGDTLESTREVRTSQGTFVSRGDDPEGILAYIEDKIAVLTGIPAGHGEAFNILRYKNGQHYDSHYDSVRVQDAPFVFLFFLSFSSPAIGTGTSSLAARVSSSSTRMATESRRVSGSPRCWCTCRTWRRAERRVSCSRGWGEPRESKRWITRRATRGSSTGRGQGTRCCSGACTRTDPRTSIHCTGAVRWSRESSGLRPSGLEIGASGAGGPASARGSTDKERYL